MKVAIIGAGLAGLSCAFELEKYGIQPVIYERNSFIGDQEAHVAVVLNLADRQLGDPLKYIGKKYGLGVTALNTINKLTHFSPNRKGTIEGNLGYFTKRGKEADSLKVQLYSQLRNTKVIFNEKQEYDALQKAYDYVVMATGEPGCANELGCWIEWVSGYIKGAIVLGDFNPTELVMWVNKDYTNAGYAYLTPYNNKKACIALFVPSTDQKNIDYYWDLFVGAENIKYTVLEEFKRKHYSGYVYPHKVGNVLFTGGSGGGIDPFLGFGQINSILMGIKAGRAIAEGLDYDELIKDIMKKISSLHEFRKSFNRLSNSDYDKIITSIGLPILRQVIYFSSLDIVKLGASAIRLKHKLIKPDQKK